MKAGSAQSWQTNLLIAGAVILVVVLALLLSQLDLRQRRSNLPARQLPILDLQATIEAGDLSIVYLPSELTPTSTSANATEPTAPSTGTITVTAVSILNPTCGAAPVDWKSYKVDPEDSLSELAVRFGVSVKAIVQANCLIHEQIIADQILMLPKEPITPNILTQCEAPQGWIQYVVVPGDNLSNLARSRGTTILKVMKANCLENTYLIAGRKIFLPPQILHPTKPGPMFIAPTATRSGPIIFLTPTRKMATSTPPVTTTPTISPISTSTREPGITPVNTLTPTRMETITPDNLPTSTPTPLPPSPTSILTNTPPPTDTAPPTNTPVPENTPLPSATPIPENPLPPTETPQPNMEIPSPVPSSTTGSYPS